MKKLYKSFNTILLLLTLLTLGSVNAWGDTATLNQSSNKTFGSTTGISFSISNLGNWTNRDNGTFSTNKHCAGYKVSKSSVAEISWDGIASGKCVNISSVVIKGTVASGATAAFKNKKMYAYTSVSTSGTTVNINSSGHTSAQTATISGDSFLKDIGNSGYVKMYSNDNDWYIESIVITYTIDNLPKFYFKAVGVATPMAGGSTEVSFDNSTFTSGQATTNVTGANLSTSSAKKTAYFKAEPTGDYQFIGWFSDSQLKNRITEETTYEEEITSTSTSSTNPKTLTVYAGFSLLYTPAFYGAGQNLKVGGTYSGFSFEHTSTTTPSSNTTAKFYYVISDVTVGTENTIGSPDGSKVIAFDGTTITALNKGTAKITFYQRQDDDNHIAEGHSETYTFTVTKNDPTFTWASAPFYYNNTVNNFYSSDNKDTQISAESNDTQVATIDGTTFKAYNKAGTARITVSQAENYYWAYHQEYIDVTPEKVNKHVQFTINEALYNTLKDNSKSSGSHTWDAGMRVGDPGAGFNWDDKYVVVGPFEGIPDKLSGMYSCSDAATGREWKIFESANGTSWGNAIMTSSSAGNVSNLQLQPTTRYLKFLWSGNFAGYFSNMTVTELQYFKTAATAFDFNTNQLNHAPATQSFEVKHANAGYQTAVSAPEHYLVSLDNVNFASSVVVSTNATAQTGGDIMGTFTVYVKYLADAEGTHEGNVIVSNNLRTDLSVSVTGTTQGKLATHINYIGSASYPVDTTNIAASALFEVRDANNDLVSNAAITLASNSEIAPIVSNAVDPVCSGSVTITASYAGDETYAAATNLPQTITINKIDDEISSSLPSVVVVGDEYVLANLATAKSETEITYWSSNTNLVDFVNGKLVAKSKGAGSVTIRFTSAGNCVYNSAVEEIELTIRKPTDPCNTLLLDDPHKANLGTYNGYTLANPKKYVIADGPMDVFTYKAWKYPAATQDIYIWLTTKDYSDPNVDFDVENDIIEEIYYKSSELPTEKENAINGSVDMKVGNRPNTRYIFAFAADKNYILPGTLYKYVSNVKITQQCYLTANALTPATMPTVTACDTAKAQFTLDYSDVGPIRLSASKEIADGLTYEVWKNGVKIDAFDNSCGDYGTYTVKLFYVPLTSGDYSGKVTLSASGKNVEINISGTVNAALREIVWGVADQNTAFVDKAVENVLTAYAKTECVDPAGEVTYTVAPEGAATINGTSVTFNTSGTITITAATVSSDLYGAATPVTKTWKVSNGYIFSGNGTWEETTKWEDNLVPTTNQDIIVTGNLTIDGDREVNSLTIQGTGSVTLVENGKLTINGDSKDADNYGDLFVKNGGEVDVNGSLRVANLTVEASIGTSNGTSRSGQIAKAERITYANAYIEINMDPTGTLDDTKWYGFTVPFEVNAHTGVSRKDGKVYRDCSYGSDYIIAEYDAAKRLSSGKGWKYLVGNTLNAGQFYYFGANGTYNTYRFKAAESSYSAVTEKSLSMNGSGSDANWNAVGNSTLQHVKASYAGGSYVQVYQNGLEAYKTVPTSSTTFVVGCPFFIQASETSTLTLSEPMTKGATAYYAPRRSVADEENEAVCINFSSVDGGYSDPIYVSATDKEENTYILGRDLSKAGECKIVPQMWVNEYGKKLSVHEAAWQGNNAFCALGLYVPADGEYTLSAAQTEDNNTQIYLTMDNQPIWNLTQSEYTVALEKGTSNAYGLMMVKAPAITTGVEQTQTSDVQESKVMINGMLFILRNGEMFDAVGRKVK